MVCAAQRLYCASVKAAPRRAARTCADHSCGDCATRDEAGPDFRGLIHQAAKVDEFRTVTEDLADRHSGNDLPSFKSAAQKIRVDQRSGHSGQQHQSHATCPAEYSVRRRAGSRDQKSAGEYPHHEGDTPKQNERYRFGGT